MSILIIYVNGRLDPAIEQEYHAKYGGEFNAIVQRDAQFFDKPRRGTTAFALECFHTDHILTVRAAHEALGIPELSLNMPEKTTQTPKESSVVAPAPKTRRKRRTKAEIEADKLAEADNDGTDNDTRGE